MIRNSQLNLRTKIFVLNRPFGSKHRWYKRAAGIQPQVERLECSCSQWEVFYQLCPPPQTSENNAHRLTTLAAFSKRKFDFQRPLSAPLCSLRTKRSSPARKKKGKEFLKEKWHWKSQANIPSQLKAEPTLANNVCQRPSIQCCCQHTPWQSRRRFLCSFMHLTLPRCLLWAGFCWNRNQALWIWRISPSSTTMPLVFASPPLLPFLPCNLEQRSRRLCGLRLEEKNSKIYFDSHIKKRQ